MAAGTGLPGATRAWVEEQLAAGESVVGVLPLRGGWTSEMRRLDVEGPGGRRSLVLRSFVEPFYVRHAEGLLNREADVLRLLARTDVPAAEPVAVDATAAHCAHPSLLMSLLPGAVRVDDAGARRRRGLLAARLLDVHRVAVTARERPRAYQAWTSPERVRPPAGTERPGLWRRAVDAIRREAPDHQGCFLHRDFHPGNVLFEGDGDATRISGVVDWVETSWGPADLDVAHCSTALALLHGVPAGMRFADLYAEAGGTLSRDPADHLYWRLLDALAYAPDGGKVGTPWRELGRTDLTPAVLAGRLEAYVRALFDRYG
ncbi:phosphotransferase family protein [Streptomyces sudanensis]|uniref:phosphotransferase family protein n=1 Tax=Streptomyces sudanensis TaxID=436397 RepID=UPI0020CE402C|nr:phosphotransferase [Streptomyces sudanensis]MCP9958961.1 phosphotransferase [Streptomyces sudanensis]MCP9988029.1 phosphotransferase [Streptomyces sudanensis]MCQ0000564.1 phosphotransferase [Streptomyces sudanensis]